MTDQTGQNTAGSAGQSPLKTIPQAAAMLGRSERTVRRWVKSGKLQTVELAGQVYVQPDSLDKLTQATGATGVNLSNDTQKQAEVSGSVQVYTDKLEQALRDTIDRQGQEIQTLRTENAAKQTTIDGLLRMLPAPQTPTTEAQGAKVNRWIWIGIGILAAVLVFTLAYVVFSRPIHRPAGYQTSKAVSTIGGLNFSILKSCPATYATGGKGYFEGRTFGLYPYP